MNSKLAPQKKILLVNGPNLNLLGTREPGIYGSTSLKDIEQQAHEHAARNNIDLQSFQSNHEGHLIDRIHEIRSTHNAIVINPGAFAHTSVALRDALSGVALPFVEVHISNVHKREPFRHHSYLNDKAEGVICGLGVYGYFAAVEYFARKWSSEAQAPPE